MSPDSSLFDVQPRYCIDTNVVVSFLSTKDDEFYGRDVFPQQWDTVERLIASGDIVAPRQVEVELERRSRSISEIRPWLDHSSHMFRDLTDLQFEWAKRIVNVYSAYGQNENYLGDLEVLTLAASERITIVTLEQARPEVAKSRPRIPEVCKEFAIGCTSVAGFLRMELDRAAGSK